MYLLILASLIGLGAEFGFFFSGLVVQTLPGSVLGICLQALTERKNCFLSLQVGLNKAIQTVGSIIQATTWIKTCLYTNKSSRAPKRAQLRRALDINVATPKLASPQTSGL